MSANNFGMKIEASGDPDWYHMSIQNHAVEVNNGFTHSVATYLEHTTKKTIF